MGNKQIRPEWVPSAYGEAAKANEDKKEPAGSTIAKGKDQVPVKKSLLSKRKPKGR